MKRTSVVELSVDKNAEKLKLEKRIAEYQSDEQIWPGAKLPKREM